MSAKIVSATKPPVPSTPVIIKSGGGLEDNANLPEPTTPVDIESSVTFVELVREIATWQSSRSTVPGRIASFTIDDAVLINCNLPDQSRDLASITILYGSDHLIVRESRGDESEVFLVIESPEISFSGPESGEWTRSTTTFPHLMKSVTLMVGDRRELHHECHSASVEVTINFQQS